MWREFDFVAELLADGRAYLCGDRFSAADLTFAALAAPMVVPPEYTVPLPQPDALPSGPRGLVERAREHPGRRARTEDVQAASPRARRRSELSHGGEPPRFHQPASAWASSAPAPAASMRSPSSRPSADGSAASP